MPHKRRLGLKYYGLSAEETWPPGSGGMGLSLEKETGHGFRIQATLGLSGRLDRADDKFDHVYA